MIKLARSRCTYQNPEAIALNPASSGHCITLQSCAAPARTGLRVLDREFGAGLPDSTIRSLNFCLRCGVCD